MCASGDKGWIVSLERKLLAFSSTLNNQHMGYPSHFKRITFHRSILWKKTETRWKQINRFFLLLQLEHLLVLVSTHFFLLLLRRFYTKPKCVYGCHSHMIHSLHIFRFILCLCVCFFFLSFSLAVQHCVCFEEIGFQHVVFVVLTLFIQANTWVWTCNMEKGIYAMNSFSLETAHSSRLSWCLYRLALASFYFVPWSCCNFFRLLSFAFV